MSKFTKFCQDFYRDEEGLTVVEYVVGAGLLVAGFSVLFTEFSKTLSSKLGDIASNIGNGTSAGTGTGTGSTP